MTVKSHNSRGDTGMSSVKALPIPMPGKTRKVGDECPYCLGILIAHRGSIVWYLRCRSHECPSAHMFYLSEEEERIIRDAQK